MINPSALEAMQYVKIRRSFYPKIPIPYEVILGKYFKRLK